MTDRAKVIPIRPSAASKPRTKKKRRKTKRSQGSVYERNGRWYLKFRVTDPASGVRERKTEAVEGATSRSEAVLALDRRLASIADGSYFSKESRKVLMFDAVAEDFLTWARAEKKSAYSYELAIRNAAEMFAAKPLSAVTLAELETFRTRLVQRLVEKRVAREGGQVSEDRRREFVQSARATCNRRMTVLRRMFNRLVEYGELPPAENPFLRGETQAVQ